MFPLVLCLALSLALCTFAVDFPALVNVSWPLNLAIDPACGPLDSENFTDINTGIVLSNFRTIVAFGDSWHSNGANGTVAVLPMMWPPYPFAGSPVTSNRRASNGFVWVEHLANSLGAKMLNYAWGGAVIDNFAWNTTSPNNATSVPRADFNGEVQLYLLQGKYMDSLLPNETLYTVGFGINDENQWERAGGDWELAYRTYVKNLGELQASGATNILIHGKYTSHTNVDILQSRVFAYMRESHSVNGTNFAFINIERLFTAITNTPSSFGYTSTGNHTCLVDQNSSLGSCTDPDRSVFWFSGHPSTMTHKLMSDYTVAVLDRCGL